MESESRKKIEPSFDGDIQEIPNIYVDNFKSVDKMAYFLSHAHADHTCGLFNKINCHSLYENGAKIYMSDETRTILSNDIYFYDETRLYEIVETLTDGMTYSIDLPDGQTIQVTPISVTHMVGAVMFLFETNEKTILYTGDFIVENECQIKELTKLHDKDGNPLEIDTMYVDATFDTEDYEHFPSRTLCHRDIVNAVENWLSEDDHKVAFYKCYDYGYEDIYKEIYKKIETQLFYTNNQKVDTFSVGINRSVSSVDCRSYVHIVGGHSTLLLWSKGVQSVTFLQTFRGGPMFSSGRLLEHPNDDDGGVDLYIVVPFNLRFEFKKVEALYGDATFCTDRMDNKGNKLKIHICHPKRKPWQSHNICGVATAWNSKFLQIFMSAKRGCSYYPERNSAIDMESDGSIYLCYPTHCSKSQLDFFIKYFSPKRHVKFPRTPMPTPDPGVRTPFKLERERRRVDEERRENVKRRLDSQL